MSETLNSQPIEFAEQHEYPDWDAQLAAYTAAVQGKWEQFAQPGFEGGDKVKSIISDAHEEYSEWSGDRVIDPIEARVQAKEENQVREDDAWEAANPYSKEIEDRDDEDEDNEDPLAGDVDPTGGYYEEPLSADDAHADYVARMHGG